LRQVLSLAGAFVAAFALAAVRHFFELSVPTPGMVPTAAVASLVAIGALAIAGFTPRSGGSEAIPDG
jgi:hypothetical protein